MKHLPYLLIFSALLFYSSPLYAQDKNPVFIPELNWQYIYESVKSDYITYENGDRYTDCVRRKKLLIRYVSVAPANQNYLLVKVIENVVQRPAFDPEQYLDYRYPDYNEGFNKTTNSDGYEGLLSTVEFQFELDVEKKEVKLHNRGEVLLQVREALIKKGYDKKGTDRHTTNFNTRGIPEISQILQKIYFVSEEVLKEAGDRPSSLNLKTSRQDSLVTVFYEKENVTKGLKHIHYIYNLQNQVMYEYNAIRIDSLKWPVTAFDRKYSHFFREEAIRLVSLKDIPEEKLYITGVIKNVRNKKVTVGVLRNPFGTELHLVTALLDENGSFEIETGFFHAGMVHLQFGQALDAKDLPMLMFYAEPGSRIHVWIDAKTYPQQVEFSGDYSREADMIHEYRKNYGSASGSFNWNTIYTVWRAMDYCDFYEGLTKLDSFLNDYRKETNPDVFEFISSELRARILSMGFHFLKLKENWMARAFEWPEDPDLGKIDVSFILGQIEKYSIYNSYNNYGIYSRVLANDILEYYFTKSRKVSTLRGFNSFGYSMVFSEYRYMNDLPHQVEVARLFLAGHPLYSQLADLLQQEKMRIRDDSQGVGNYRSSEIEKYLELMLLQVNDPEFSVAISQMMNNYRLWQKKDYVPEVEFLNLKGDQVHVADFFGQKPSVFYVTSNWGIDRYFWDDLAKENQEMNLVMVMEGSNFAEWTDYITRAEPVAHQLFLMQKLKDVFKSDNRHFIAYDKNGDRLGFASNPVEAVNLVKQSLMDEVKEPDKSQLIFFIIVLTGLFISTFLVLAIWKWRVRLRFRKEQQQRRLRELELTAIRSQMNPHFLFNCLNSVQNLVLQNKGREAHLYLANFAGLIRKVLNNSEKEEVSLAEELDMVKQYLTLEKLRFYFDFQFSISDEVDVYNTSVPSMLLQPFAENAVTHGLQNKPENRKLKIEVFKKTEAGKSKINIKGILISIEDNGIGRAAAQKTETPKNGKGTKLTQERLAILQQKNKERYWLRTTDLCENGRTGTKVEIFVPEEY